MAAANDDASRIRQGGAGGRRGLTEREFETLFADRFLWRIPIKLFLNKLLDDRVF